MTSSYNCSLPKYQAVEEVSPKVVALRFDGIESSIDSFGFELPEFDPSETSLRIENEELADLSDQELDRLERPASDRTSGHIPD